MPLHDFFYCQRNGAWQEVDFENWLMSFDIPLSLQTSAKKSCMKVEIIVSKFIFPTPLKEGRQCGYKY
jgi:hypothetical protein